MDTVQFFSSRVDVAGRNNKAGVISVFAKSIVIQIRGIRSPALTMYETGPTADPWIMLAARERFDHERQYSENDQKNNLPASDTHSLEYRDLPVSEEQ